MNEGDSERGEAKGFNLAFLSTLSSTKSNLKIQSGKSKSKLNFLQFATVVARRIKQPDGTPLSESDLRIKARYR